MSRLKTEYRIDHRAKVMYSDSLSEGKKKPKLFKSQKLRISGRPDAIIEVDGKAIPVELKTGKVPQGPYFSHILQLGAYGLLMEEEYGTLPPYGLIKYGPKGEEKEFKVEMDKRLMFTLAGKIGEMRLSLESGEAHRNHNRPGKCTNCSRRKNCPESLAK
jgi:CRISPR-associated exonuclease Cas4